MRAALFGALSGGGFDPIALTGVLVPVTNTYPAQTVSVPSGAVSVSIYLVTAGGNAQPGDYPYSGNGGDCFWNSIPNSVVGITALTIDFSRAAVSTTPSGTITLINHNTGGGGGGGGLVWSGGAAATEIAAGPSAIAGQIGGSIIHGPASVTAGSVLAGYVGHGGDLGAGANANGVGWGGGGALNYDGSIINYGVGGPPGALIIFK